MRKLKRIIIHCTATKPEWMANHSVEAKVKTIRKWHMQDRGWRDIGYHFIVDRDGKVAEGRPVSETGAHVVGHNRDSIGVSLVGGHGGAEDQRFEENFTPEQDQALRGLIAYLQKEYGPGLTLHGHNEYAAKACPTFQVARWWKRKDPVHHQKEKKGEVATVAGVAAGAAGAVVGVGAMDFSADTLWAAVAGLLVVGALVIFIVRRK